MKVLIVSKTHMSSMACVGGLLLGSNRFLRLLNRGNYNQPGNTDLQVGDIWEMRFIDRRTLEPPHVEDVIVLERRFITRVADMDQFIRSLNVINWYGPIGTIFDEKVYWSESGSGYIPESGALPSSSVGFWVTDQPLIKSVYESKVRYCYSTSNEVKRMAYVGYQEQVDEIPAGTILRVSLSRIFPKVGMSMTVPKGYYVQLSGWYLPLLSKAPDLGPPPLPPIWNEEDGLPYWSDED